MKPIKTTFCQQRYFSFMAVSCIGLCVSVLMFYIVSNKESTTLEADFKFAAWDRINSLEREMESNMEVLQSVYSLFESSEFVTRNQFKLFCKSALLNHHDIQALEWIQHVPGSQCEDYEQKAHADGYPNYQITRRGKQGEMVRANESSEHFPVYYMEPYIGNEKALGFDLATNPKRMEALNRSCDTGEIVATSRITLVQEQGNQYGFLVFLPVYGKQVSLDTVESRRENLKGFVLGVFRIGDLVETSLGYVEGKGIDIHLFDTSNPHDEQFLYFHPSRLNHYVGQSLPQHVLERDGLYISETLNIADRKWSVRCKAIPVFIENGQTWYPWGFLVGGIVFTGLLAVYLNNISGRAGILEQSVSERTADLKDSEQRLNYALGASSDGIWDWNVISGEVKFSNRWYESLGYNHEEVEGHISFWKNIIHPDDKRHTMKSLDDHIQGKTRICEVENRLRLKSGVYRYNLDIGKVVEWDNDGNPIRMVGIDKDITKRKQAEEKMKEGEVKLRSILSSLYESAIMVYDRDGNIIETWGSQEMDKRYGIRSVDTVGGSIKSFLPPEQVEERLAEIRCVFFTGKKMLVEHVVVFPGGKFWHEVSLSPIRNADDNIIAVIGFVRDITERKKTEEKLHRLSHAIEFSPSVVVITDEKGRIEYANPKFVQLTGYSLEETIGRSTNLLKSGNTSREIYRELWKVINSGNEWRGEFCNKKKNGEYYWESASISPVKNNEGIITNFIAIKEDITDYKYSERRLKAQHEVTKILSESSTIRDTFTKIIQALCTALEWDLGEIWEFDQEKNTLFNSEIWHVPTLNISEFIAVTKKTTFSPKIGLPGYVFESAEPFWIADIVHETNFPRAFVANKEGLHGAFGFPIIVGTEVLGSICFYSREIKKPDNDLLNMISAIGHQIGLFFKRKQTEETLLQSEKFNLLGSITAGIAHEFNNILGIILGSAEVLEGGYDDERAIKKGLGDIIKACDDGGVIVKSMRAFSDVEVNQSDYILSDVGHIIKEAIGFTMPRWKHVAQVSGTKFHIDTEGMKNTPEIFCNPTELREVFVNLINNAINAMPDGGSIFFSTMSSLDKVFISVSDTGIGMTEYVKKKVFDPFYSTRKPQGTGLGMSIAYSIIKRHGGNIEVESEVGKGATFILSIPISKEVVQRIERPEQISEIVCKKLRVLVIDDERRMCETLKKSFSRGGHMVKTAGNGAYAIELAERGEFDLALCDLGMPDTNGYDVIKVLNRTEHRPMIGIITGWNEDLPLLEKEEFKVNFVVRKPFSFSELAKKINEQI